MPNRGERDDDVERLLSQQLTRRRLLKFAGAGTMLAGAAPLLAACGSSSSSSSASSSSAATSSAADASGAVSQIRDLLGLPTGAAAGAGKTIPVGASMAFSGPSSIYGSLDYSGITLAVKHIKALGGPDLAVKALDNALADPAKGVANARQWGGDGVPIVMTSGGATGFSELPYYSQYKMMGLESGGATTTNQGKPYFYQTRSEYPTDMMSGIVKYVAAKYPSFKTVMYCQLDYGAAITSSQQQGVEQVLATTNFKYLGQNLAPADGTDFSSQISAIRKANPDFVVGLWPGAIAGIFMKQYATSGLKAPIIGFDYTPDAAKVAGKAFAPYQFAFDYFDAVKPPNKWATIFVDEYKAANKGALPTYYSANYYEATFLVWQMIREIIAAKGDPTKQGAFYTDALEANPTFPSLYGGDGGAHGMKTIDAKTTHSLVSVPMVYAEAGATGTPTILATYNKGGKDFKLV